jgi:Tol biopolymer transport system component
VWIRQLATSSNVQIVAPEPLAVIGGLIWVSDGAGGNPREIVQAMSSSGTSDDVTWAADRVVFTSTIGGHRSISSVGLGGATSQEVVSQGSSPTSTSDGRTVVFRSTDPARHCLWKIGDAGRLLRLSAARPSFPA